MRANPALVDFVDRQWVEMVPALAAAALRNDQARVFKHAQMLHDRAAVEVAKMGAQGAGGQRLVLEIIEDLPADLVAERLEYPVVCVRV